MCYKKVAIFFSEMFFDSNGWRPLGGSGRAASQCKNTPAYICMKPRPLATDRVGAGRNVYVGLLQGVFFRSKRPGPIRR